jgi:hypothetical protein
MHVCADERRFQLTRPEISMDNIPLSNLLLRMASSEKLVTPVSLVVDFVLTVAFFAFMFWLVKSHVPSNDPKMVWLWAGLCSACMSGVFWLAVQMFRVVLRAQMAANRAKRSSV